MTIKKSHKKLALHVAYIYVLVNCKKLDIRHCVEKITEICTSQWTVLLVSYFGKWMHSLCTGI